MCTFLENRNVAVRQVNGAEDSIRKYGFKSKIKVINDRSNSIQKGSTIVLWGKTNTGTLLGGDAIGQIGKPSEVVGREAAEKLLRELVAKATVDIHLADMLVPYVALANGTSIYLTREVTDHLATNIWLTQRILGVKFRITKVGGLNRVEKI